MPVPTSISQLSQTPSSNSPLGTENVGTIMNQYIQAAFAFIAQLNASLNPTGTLTAPSGTRLVMQQPSAPAGWYVDPNAALSDCAMRFNQSAGIGGVNGWSSFFYGGAFNGTTSSTAITTAQMPSHNHGVNDPGHNHGTWLSDPGHGHGVSDPGHHHQPASGASFWTNAGTSYIGQGSGNGAAIAEGTTSNVATGIGIQAAGSNISIGTYGAATGISTQYNGGNGGHTHTWSYGSTNMKYADCIVAVKS